MIKVEYLATRISLACFLTYCLAWQLLDSGNIFEEENESTERTRKKPLPATYEPGNCACYMYPFVFLNQYPFYYSNVWQINGPPLGLN